MGGMAEMIGGTAFAILALSPAMWAFTLVPVLVYLVARFRLAREGGVDTHVGIKLLFAHFAYVAYQVLLVGLCLLVYAFLSDKGGGTKEDLLRTAAAMVLPSALLLGGALATYRKTNHREQPMVGKMYVGVNRLQIFGTFAIAFYFLSQVLLQKNSDADMASAGWSVLLVYFAACAFEGLRMKDELKSRVPSLAPAAPPPPPPPPQTGSTP